LINHQHHYHPQEQINCRQAYRNHSNSTTIRNRSSQKSSPHVMPFQILLD
jgi:hypothetical protein